MLGTACVRIQNKKRSGLKDASGSLTALTRLGATYSPIILTTASKINTLLFLDRPGQYGDMQNLVKSRYCRNRTIKHNLFFKTKNCCMHVPF